MSDGGDRLAAAGPDAPENGADRGTDRQGDGALDRACAPREGLATVAFPPELGLTVPGPYMPAPLRPAHRGTTAELVFEDNVDRVFAEAEELLLSKHADYGPTNIGNSPGGPLNGLRVRIWDKVARINHLLDNDRDPRHEALADSFMDLANYAIIAILVLRHQWPGQR